VTITRKSAKTASIMKTDTVLKTQENTLISPQTILVIHTNIGNERVECFNELSH
jgi:hypothetical protein